MTVKLVRQRDAHGCGVACLAMVTGLDYSEVRSWFKVFAWQNAFHDGRQLRTEEERNAREPLDFTRHGISHWDVEQFLAEHEHAYARLHGKRPSLADVHICSIQMVEGSHFVVWLRDGRVFDPAFGETTLDDPRFYGGVHYVIGVWKARKLAA